MNEWMKEGRKESEKKLMDELNRSEGRTERDE